MSPRLSLGIKGQNHIMFEPTPRITKLGNANSFDLSKKRNSSDSIRHALATMYNYCQIWVVRTKFYNLVEIDLVLALC